MVFHELKINSIFSTMKNRLDYKKINRTHMEELMTGVICKPHPRMFVQFIKMSNSRTNGQIWS